MANKALPLLVAGGAALLLMGGKKKSKKKSAAATTESEPKHEPEQPPPPDDSDVEPYKPPGKVPGNGGTQPEPEPMPGPTGPSALELEIRDQARLHNLGQGDEIGAPPLAHGSAFISEDCSKYLIGRDFLPALPFGGKLYTPAKFWKEFGSSTPPNFPRTFPKPSTHWHFLNETLKHFFKGVECLEEFPKREDFPDEDAFIAAQNEWVDAYPDVAEFVKQIEILIYFDMMAAMKADDVERYYAWRELWHSESDAIHQKDNAWSSQYLSEVTDNADRKAYPNDPFPIPSKNHSSAKKWNRILNYVNGYRNDYYGV